MIRLKEPGACTEWERREFERFVRDGFDGSDDRLPGRIRAAKCLAFQRAAGGELTAIAALKAPPAAYRESVFRKAGVPDDPDGYRLELGWVHVARAQRGNRTAEALCQQLLASVPGAGVFATTRPDNTPMARILSALGFRRAGRPYRRRQQELVVFLMS